MLILNAVKGTTNYFTISYPKVHFKNLGHEDNKTNITVKYGVTMLGIKKYFKYNLL